ncbi:hypothetical protein [Ascidiimonas sp. W6]|uniref:hypothetical protein n=1 Tax=Ascidiimonas meishanensis TaxID=3128903 RepID=UPI0030EF9025
MVGDIENQLGAGSVPEVTDAVRRMFELERRIIEAKYPGDAEKVEATLNRYIQRYPEMEKKLKEDIYGKDAFNIELVVPDLIHEAQLSEFFGTVLDKYSKFSTEAIEKDYINTPKAWFESKSNRARLVLAEATNFNLKEIAAAVINASPLERVVAVGLEVGEKQEAFKEALIEEWQIKFEAKGDEYQAKVMNALSEITQKPFTANLADYDIQDLMGPHTFTNNQDISLGNLNRELGSSFHSKIDEVILLGNENKLAAELPILSEKIGAQQYLALKASAFSLRNNSPFWTAHLRAEHEPLKVLTSSKNPEAILSPGKFDINPDLDRIFREMGIKHGLKEKEVNFLKNLFLDKSLYMNNLSPQLYATTITKAQSGINGKGAIVVGEALPWAIIGRIIATALGARFAVNATMIDTANDMHQEQQEHRLGYKNMFTELVVSAQNKGNEPEESFEGSLDQLFSTYAMTEKSDTVSLLVDIAEDQRIVALKHANLGNQKNEFGIKLLKPQPLNFAYAVIATGVGLAASFSTFSPSVAFPLVGTGMFAGATSLLAKSLFAQKDANVELAHWHRASATGRQFSKNVQDVRDHLIKEKTAGLIPSEAHDEKFDLVKLLEETLVKLSGEELATYGDRLEAIIESEKAKRGSYAEEKTEEPGEYQEMEPLLGPSSERTPEKTEEPGEYQEMEPLLGPSSERTPSMLEEVLPEPRTVAEVTAPALEDTSTEVGIPATLRSSRSEGDLATLTELGKVPTPATGSPKVTSETDRARRSKTTKQKPSFSN